MRIGWLLIRSVALLIFWLFLLWHYAIDHFGPNSNMSTTVDGFICPDINLLLKKRCHYSDDPLTFRLAPTWGQYFQIVQYFDVRRNSCKMESPATARLYYHTACLITPCTWLSKLKYWDCELQYQWVTLLYNICNIININRFQQQRHHKVL